MESLYPRTAKVRLFIHLYAMHQRFEEVEPTTVTLHETYTRYGGAEEGGWYFLCGIPLKTVCIFNKKQAIRTAVKLYEEAIEEYGSEKDEYGWNQFEINFDNNYAKHFPVERPYYE
jgi:hypothetical protein